MHIAAVSPRPIPILFPRKKKKSLKGCPERTGTLVSLGWLQSQNQQELGHCIDGSRLMAGCHGKLSGLSLRCLCVSSILHVPLDTRVLMRNVPSYDL